MSKRQKDGKGTPLPKLRRPVPPPPPAPGKLHRHLRHAHRLGRWYRQELGIAGPVSAGHIQRLEDALRPAVQFRVSEFGEGSCTHVHHPPAGETAEVCYGKGNTWDDKLFLIGMCLGVTWPNPTTTEEWGPAHPMWNPSAATRNRFWAHVWAAGQAGALFALGFHGLTYRLAKDLAGDPYAHVERVVSRD